MKTIRSKCDRYDIIVDDDLHDMIIAFAPNGWEVKYTTGAKSPYAYTRKTVTNSDGTRARKGFYMHRLVMDVLDNSSIHIDHKVVGSTLDNRRENLRPATRVQNMKNRSASQSGFSPYLGVSFCMSKRGSKRFRVCIQDKLYRKGNIHLGYYYDELSAAYAYNLAAVIIHGEFANLNEVDVRQIVDVDSIHEYVDGVLEKYGVTKENAY